MSGALESNLSLANALAGFSKTLFGAAPVTQTEEEGSTTSTKQTSLSPAAIQAMLREMTEGGLSGGGGNGIAGLAAIMGGQKSAGLYNSSTAMQLMNKNMANIAGQAALASAATTTTTTPKKSTKTTAAPGMVSTPAGQIGLLLAGVGMLKNKKFKDMIGIGDDAGDVAKNAFEPFKYESEYGPGDTPGNSAMSVPDTNVSELASPEIVSDASNLITNSASDTFLTGADSVIDSGVNAVDSVMNGFAGDVGEVGESVSGFFDTGITDSLDEVADAGNIFDSIFSFFAADGGLVPSPRKMADGGIFNAITPKKPIRTVSSPIASPNSGYSPIVTSKKKSSDEFDDVLGTGAIGGTGGGVAGQNAASNPNAISQSSFMGQMVGHILGALLPGYTMIQMIDKQSQKADSIPDTALTQNLDAEDADIGVQGMAMLADTMATNLDNSLAAPVGNSSDSGNTGDVGSADGTAMKSGGPVSGPGTSTSDSINVKLSAGEYVIPADVVSKLGEDFFDDLLSEHHTPVSVQKRRMQ